MTTKNKENEEKQHQKWNHETAEREHLKSKRQEVSD